MKFWTVTLRYPYPDTYVHLEIEAINDPEYWSSEELAIQDVQRRLRELQEDPENDWEYEMVSEGAYWFEISGPGTVRHVFSE